MGITQKIYMVPMYVCMGLSQGIMPLVSYNYASGNQRRMRSAVVFTGAISIGFITAASLFFYVGAAGVVRFFMDNPSIIAHGIRFLRGFCLGLPFQSKGREVGWNLSGSSRKWLNRTGNSQEGYDGKKSAGEQSVVWIKSTDS